MSAVAHVLPRLTSKVSIGSDPAVPVQNSSTLLSITCAVRSGFGGAMIVTATVPGSLVFPPMSVALTEKVRFPNHAPRTLNVVAEVFPRLTS